jgi:glycosyltransferase involved in cell wall biosynthesis
MRINFTLFGSKLTGGTFNIIEPAERLAERGHEVSINTIGNESDLDWFPKNRKIAFKKIFTPVSGKLWYRFFRKALKGTILHPFPDVEIKDLIRSMPECDVNVATAAPTAFAVHRSGKGRGFYYVQHYDSLFGKNSLENRVHDESYYLPLGKITVSSWLKDVIRERLDVEAKAVITAGIDEKVFYPREKKNKKTKIISLGRKVDWKGFAELQEAVKNLMKKRDDFEWVVYSSHDTPESVPEAPFTLVRSPYGKGLAELYASCDIAVNPSWHEGFAQPALEAMASGCAVVTTKIGAEDFMEPDKNCLLVEPKSSGQIEAALERLLDDAALRHRIAENGLATSKEFHWDRIIDKWEKTLSAS